jgi:lipoate-protein ligase A
MPNKRFNKQVPAFKAGGRAGKMGGGMMMQKPMMKKGGDVKKIEKTFKPKNKKKVPNKFKVFSKIPEKVQQKIDAKLAKKV